jgi:hypothetical protein
VTDKGVTILAEQLKTNQPLTNINLWGNVIGIAGAIALEEALCDNKTVRYIKLDGNSDIMDSSNKFTPPTRYAGHHTFDQLVAATSFWGRRLC